MRMNGDQFPAVKFLGRFGRFAIDKDMAAIDQFLDS